MYVICWDPKCFRRRVYAMHTAKHTLHVQSDCVVHHHHRSALLYYWYYVHMERTHTNIHIERSAAQCWPN